MEKIKRDIQWLIENKREKRRAITVETEEKGIWEHFNEEKEDQDEAKNENQDEPGESEFGQGWNTVKYFGKR